MRHALTVLSLCLGLAPLAQTDIPLKPVPGVRTVSFLVTLSEEPASRVYARTLAASTAARAEGEAVAARAAAAQRERVSRQQDAFVKVVRAAPFRADVLYRVQRASNGVAIAVAPAHLERLRKLEGVAAVQPLDTDRHEPKRES